MSPVRGVVRKIDHLGRIVIPVEIRRVFGIVPGDDLDIALSADGAGITVTKVENNCVICASSEGLVDFKGRLVCFTCRRGLVSTLPVTSGQGPGSQPAPAHNQTVGMPAGASAGGPPPSSSQNIG